MPVALQSVDKLPQLLNGHPKKSQKQLCTYTRKLIDMKLDSIEI